ncbi:unnamed protein product [Brachionus calyciflorus]|uniref:Daxx histone-binding domain-containing protein n=1 Tax=Brachionus calyciflorus TaxID=104777 RepID=A0A813UW81_9BILA|nr:unnamed protein product [Brachionus calyciflorus]
MQNNQEPKSHKILDLISIFEENTENQKLLKPDRLEKIKQAILFVQKLYANSNISDNEEKFTKLLEKCQISLRTSTNTILADLCDLASFIKENKNSSKSSSQISSPHASDSSSSLNEKIENVNKEKRKLTLNELTKVTSNYNNENTDLKSEEENITIKKNVTVTVEESVQINEKEVNVKLTEETRTETEVAVTSSEPTDEFELKDLTDKELKILEKIKKLDDYCLQLNEKIIDYENREVSYDDLDKEESNYLNEAKLKNRFTKAYKMLVNLCRKFPHLVSDDHKKVPKDNCPQFSKKIKFNSSRYAEINNYISDRLNKNREFPDFSELYEWVNQANTEHQLGLDDKKLHEVSQNCFEDVVKILKSRRIADERQILMSRVESIKTKNEQSNVESELDNDPAQKDQELEIALANNKKICDKKCEELINTFVMKQENNEDFEVNEDDDDDDETESDTEDSESIKQDENLLDTSTKVSSDNDETDDTNLNEDLVETNKENIEESKQTERETAKRSCDADEPIESDNVKKLKLDSNEDSNDSVSKPKKTKPMIYECSSAAQSSDECIILD